jgi:hypothetical protein
MKDTKKFRAQAKKTNLTADSLQQPKGMAVKSKIKAGVKGEAQ